MLESLSTDKLDYEKLSLEEQQKRGILGRLTGVIADFVNPTRNGRKYSEKLWENVFQDPVMQEKIKNRCCFGELGHPADRTEVDMEKIAICLAEVPKKGKDGKLHGIFDILDTPNGRILKCLCDYGCNIGVSSRGEGDLITGLDGEDEVDPDTYVCECWDIVCVPSVQTARMAYVHESLETKSTLKESLDKLINASSDDDKKVMKESLQLLNIDSYSQEETPVNNIEEESSLAVDNNEADNELLTQLQESLQTQQRLLDNVSELQEKLSVSYTKETTYQEEIEKYQKAIVRLKESANRLKIAENKIQKLQEQLNNSNQQIQNQNAICEDLKQKLSQSTNQNKTLNESLEKINSSSSKSITQLNNKVTELMEQISTLKDSNENDKQKLSEEYESKLKDSQIKVKELSGKVEKYKSIAEKYQKIALKSVDKYIESKAVSLGISANEIKNRLSETYTFTDIDNICENLRQYKININNLPFSSNTISKQITESSRVSTRASKNESILPKNKMYEDVDEVDEQLLSLAGIN